MPETSVTEEPDLRAGRFVSSLRSGRGLSPEQMGKLCGVGGQTIRDIEAKGTYPQLGTQERVAAFFGLSKEQIWRDPRRQISRKRTPPQKALLAVQAACDDEEAQALVRDLAEGQAFAFGVAWAVIRGLSPFAGSNSVAEKAMEALERHGAAGTARIGA